jgi:hypothetical protein
MKHRVDLSPELRSRTGIWGADPIVKGSAAINTLLKFAATLLQEEKTINRISVTNDDPTVQAAITTYGSALLGVNARIYPKPGSTESLDFRFNSKVAVSHLYASMGWEPCLAAGKHLGPRVRCLDSGGLRAFLQGYMDCECSIDKSGIEVSSASWKLLFEIKMALMAHFGITGTLKEKKVAAYAENDYWRLTFCGAEADAYLAK